MPLRYFNSTTIPRRRGEKLECGGRAKSERVRALVQGSGNPGLCTIPRGREEAAADDDAEGVEVSESHGVEFRGFCFSWNGPAGFIRIAWASSPNRAKQPSTSRGWEAGSAQYGERTGRSSRISLLPAQTNLWSPGGERRLCTTVAGWLQCYRSLSISLLLQGRLCLIMHRVI